jgi:putative ABC transport system substrate-binding protein
MEKRKTPGQSDANSKDGHMRRRHLLLNLAMLGCPARASAQAGTRRVGALLVEPSQAEILQATLKAKGWKLGDTLQIDYRITRGDTDLSRNLARELIALRPDVLFAVSNTSMAALHAQRSGLPTVFAMVANVVEMGYVESFARPGANATGFTPFESSLGGKWVSLLKEAAPHVEHLGLVYNPEPGNNSLLFRNSIDEIANAAKVVSIERPSGDSSDIERLIRVLKERPNSGLIFLPDAITYARRPQITALVAECGLPAIYPFRAFCEAGGLMSYGVIIDKVIAAGASYVDLVLRGAKPAELPVQAPTEFELVVNQKTARQLGLRLPTRLLARADEVIG